MPGHSTPYQSKSGTKVGSLQVAPRSAVRTSRLRNSGSPGGCCFGSRRRELPNTASHSPLSSTAIDGCEL